jgi:hypothetical protein
LADVVSLLIEGAVAVGTIGLTVLTAYQLRRDRREAIAQELADRVYVPLRKAALGWQNPDSLLYYSPWRELQENVPYLTAKVPSDLRKLFENQEMIADIIATYTSPTVNLIKSQGWSPGCNTTIRIMEGTEFRGEIYMINIWKSGKTFDQYVKAFMAKSYPLVEIS